LITNKKLSLHEKSKIYKEFYIIDNAILPEHIAYGDFLSFKKIIINSYNNLFCYIEKNYFNLDINFANKLINNSIIGI
jgi:hypothetical protein